MAQIPFSTDTTPNLGDLDANFSELYGYFAQIQFDPTGANAVVANFNSNHASGGYMRFLNSGVSTGDIGSGAQLVSGGAASDFGVNVRGAHNLIFAVNSATKGRFDSAGNFVQVLTATPPSLVTNQEMVFNLTSNTNLRISVRGSDGTTRVANITLA